MLDSLMDALGYVGDALDKPGRAVRGLLAGNSREGLAAVPFSDSLGLTDPAERTSGQALLKSLGADVGDGLGGQLAGFGAEMATDPLTLLGAGLGAKLGRGVEKAAVARGPNYATTAAHLEDAAHEAGVMGHRVIDGIMNLPGGDRIAREIPEGSELIGKGAEALAFRGPEGDVYRLSRTGDTIPGRVVSDSVLPASRTAQVPSTPYNAFRVERTPFAENVNNAAVLNRRDPATMLTPIDQIDQGLAGEGLKFGDRHLGNVGTLDGRPVVVDPGAVDNVGFTGGRAPVTQIQDPGFVMRQLLDALGSQEAVRAGQAPRYMLPGAGLGAGLGASTGAISRSFGG